MTPKLELENIRKAFGNWKKPSLSGWEAVLHEFAIQPVHLLDMIPGMGKMTKEIAPEVTDKQFRQIEAIINSMTLEERRDPRILNGSRKRRIARGSGVTVTDVNDLLNQFRQMQRLMKQLGQGGRGLRGGLMDLFRG